jgi:uncharacterized protein (TIGR00661 family)
VRWEVFSKHSKKTYIRDNVFIQPINNEDFIKSMATCEGVLCGAGFEGPAEALYLGKKVLAIPMKTQHEQHCNAAGLQDLGVPVIPTLSEKYIPEIENWLNNPEVVHVNFPDQTEEIIDRLIEEHGYEKGRLKVEAA